MLREVTGKGATIDDAIDAAAKALGVDVADCSIEILETPKRSLFGKNREAVVKATTELESADAAAVTAPQTPKTAARAERPREEKTEHEEHHEEHRRKREVNVDPAEIAKKVEVAKNYLREILDGMGLSAVDTEVSQDEDGVKITFVGEGIAVLIGHHGETLDALQYLVALATNRVDNDYCRITLDCGNYRAKREETLKGLALRIAQKVKKTGRGQTLEPMNPYERRIIHAVVSEIDGVFSKSNGEEPNRRVVILSETPQKSGGFNRSGNGGAHRGNGQDRGGYNKPYTHKPERTMEEILKNDFKEEEKAELYSKIEL